MKKFIMQASVGLLVGGAIMSAVAGGPDVAPMVTPGLYIGLGGGYVSHWATRQYGASQFSLPGVAANVDNSYDQLDDTNSKFAPLAQVGYWMPIGEEWLWGLQATYKYLNYTTNSPTLLTNQPGLANMGAAAVKTSFNNELLLLAYAGLQFHKSYLYLGLGAVMWTVRDQFGVLAAGNPGATPGNNFTNYILESDTIWGGALQVGYNYYMKPTWFMGLNYTYAMSTDFVKSETKRMQDWNALPVVANNLRGVVDRRISIETQEFMFSINKVFQM